MRPGWKYYVGLTAAIFIPPYLQILFFLTRSAPRKCPLALPRSNSGRGHHLAITTQVDPAAATCFLVEDAVRIASEFV